LPLEPIPGFMLYRRLAPRSIRKIDRCALSTAKVVLQSNRYGDVSLFGLSINSHSIVHQQSRLECSEFRCKGAWDTMCPGQRAA
jgi:hypothetical protein